MSSASFSTATPDWGHAENVVAGQYARRVHSQPRPASELARAIDAAGEAARRGEVVAFGEAVERLLALDLEKVGVVQAAAIRSLLEERYPDGLAADDVRDLLTRCERGAGWFPGLDPGALLLVLSGALGMVDPDQAPPAGRDVLARHACLVMADLSMDSNSLGAHIAGAIAEIRRAETMEMP
jgi:hypothetical protein